MSCMAPKIPKDEEGTPRNFDNSMRNNNVAGGNNGAPLLAARRGLLKAMWQASFAPRFSSKPIDMQDYFSRESFADPSRNLKMFSSFTMDGNNSVDEDGGNRSPPSSERESEVRPSLVTAKNLTPFEEMFLQNLLQSEDLDSIRRASERLADKELFPPMMTPEETAESEMSSSSTRVHRRRGSEVQQELFRLHESTTVKPKTVLRRMSTVEKEKRAKARAKLVTATASTPLIPTLPHNNSITAQPYEETSARSNNPPKAPVVPEDGEYHGRGGSWDMKSDPGIEEDKKDDEQDGHQHGDASWNPFGDVNSWIDGNQGVEVDGDGIPDIPSPTSNPFKILGTSADDVSAHPHVLTPPLMEGLQEFMPESLHEYHFWLKYSLVRDSSRSPHPTTPPLLDMLRHCRASLYTVLAIETTSGHVFGAFCSQPWKLNGEKYWGTKDSFVWRMRHSRNEPCESIVEQVLMESKIDVFPFTGRNKNVQQCSQEHGLVLGEGEVSDFQQGEGEHFGHAIQLNAAMTEAWTSSTETFGNPSLVHTDLRGEKVDIANVELWALTPHSSIESAITLEMKQLFLAENRGPTEKNLDLLEILVGGTV